MEPGIGAPTAEHDVLAIDVGGTTIKAVVVHASGAASGWQRWPTPHAGGQEATVSAVLRTAEAMSRGRTGIGSVRAIGIACPGVLDARTGVVSLAANLAWRDVAIGALVSGVTGLPVAVIQDADAAAIAETCALRTSTSAPEDMLFVALGTGVGATPVVGGAPVSGAHRRAGEIGHLRVESAQWRPGDPFDACSCGQRGCLESVAGGAAIVRHYRHRVDGTPAPSAREIVQAATEGDQTARAVWSRATRALGEALAAYLVLMDPELVVVGGGISLAGAALLEPTRAAMRAHLPFADPPRVVAASLGDRGGLYGAALAARARLSGFEDGNRC
jgi:glucokinase